MIKILFLLILETILFSEMTQHTLFPNTLADNSLESIKFLDAKELDFKKFNGIEVTELSALAYKDRILYALGDKGVLFHFDIEIEHKRIKSLSLNKAIRLKNEYGEVLKKSRRDSEGLCIVGNDLLISFERKPRVHMYSSLGVKIKKQKIHKDLRKIKRYRSPNKALEAVAYNETYGILTAPEKSLLGLNEKIHTLYSKRKKWTFPASGSITALEFMSKHKIMVLERKFNTFMPRWRTTISMVDLKSSKYEVLAKLDSANGWSIDNFEGLTKVDTNTYLMISDDNGKFFQKTLLVLFEVN